MQFFTFQVKRRYELEAGDLVAKLKRSREIDEIEDKEETNESESNLNIPLSQPWDDSVMSSTRATSVKPKNNSNGKAEKIVKIK